MAYDRKRIELGYCGTTGCGTSPIEEHRVSNSDRILKLEKFKLRNVMVISKGYRDTARNAINDGFANFSTTARSSYQRNVTRFLNYYIKNYSNAFSKEFKNIISLHTIKSKKDFDQKYDNNSYILYRILNKKRQLVRIGYTFDLPEIRLAQYLSMAFGTPDKKKEAQIHLDIRALGDIHKFRDMYEFQIISLVNTRAEVKTLERLFTIYENRYKNWLGYDLSINDYYNRIIGDWFDYFDGDYKHSNIHPTLKIVPLETLKNAVKECSTWDEIFARFNKFNKAKIKDPTTIKKKARKYGFTIDGTGSKKDMRAFLIKPLLEKLVLKKILDPNEIFVLLKREGFTFLDNIGVEKWSKQDFLRSMINHIWRSDMEKIINFQKGQWLLTGLRRLLIYNKVKILMRDPKNNLVSKAQVELVKQGIPLRLKTKKSAIQPQYDGELLKIFMSLNRSYKEEQNTILAPILTPMLIQENPDLSLGDIAKAFGLINSVQNKKLIENMINRIFKEYVYPIVNVRQIKLFLRDLFKKGELFTQI